MKFTPSTYERISQDSAYVNKAIDALVRMNHGSKATFEIVGDNVVINNGSVIKYNDLLIQAIDRQDDLKQRPSLEKYYKDRQKRVEQSQHKGTINLTAKSEDEMNQQQAQKHMLANAQKRGFASQQQPQSKGLPSERAN